MSARPSKVLRSAASQPAGPGAKVAKLDTAREFALRAQLYARSRGEVDVVREISAAADALATSVRDWLTFLPRRCAVEQAQHAVVGLGQLLDELAVLQEGPRHAGL